jgi:predicted transcriptional regulator
MSYGDEKLKNKTRRLIYNYIISYPGVSFNALKNIFELTDSSLKYHIHLLEKYNKINFFTENGTRYYYPYNPLVNIPQKEQMLLDSYKLTTQQEQILNVIIRYPGINQKELINKTRMNRFKVIRNLNLLKDLNLIRNISYQNSVCYEYIPDAEMKYRILKRIIIEFLKNEIDEQLFLKLKKRLEG